MFAITIFPQKSWNIALAPMKQLPMNLFMMYMAGNSISIFPIMIVGMMIFKPIKAMLTLRASEYDQSFPTSLASYFSSLFNFGN